MDSERWLAIPPMKRGCANCGHLGAFHKRGWGPCTFSVTIAVPDRDRGTAWSSIEACTCRRYITAKRPVGRNGR